MSDPHANRRDTCASKLWLARHAQPLVAPGVCYGALDVAADAMATQHAAQALADVLPTGLLVLASPLQRCELLAQAIQGLRPDLAYKTEVRLAEMNFGCWEGQRWADIPQQAYDDWTADFWQHRFGGAENVAEFMARVASAWQETSAQVWITHAGVIRALRLIESGVREVHDAALWPAEAPAFGQWCVLGGQRLGSGEQLGL